jgi:hypothetical protein
VAAAREAAWGASRTGNTWAAYQCYGDPEWTWKRDGGGLQRPAASLHARYAEIASPVGLALALENLAVSAKFSTRASPRTLEEVQHLEAEYGALWREMGAVAEAFGLAYAEARDIDAAIRWYRLAVDSGDGSASFKAAEQLGNQLARRGEKLGDPREKQHDLAEARRSIHEGAALLANVVSLQPTVERESLLGSAYKRLVMVEGRAKRPQAAREALALMAAHYAAAAKIARASGAGNLFYPAKSGISAALRLAYLEGREPVIGAERFREVHASLDHAATSAPDFWVVAGQIEIKVLEALVQHRLSEAATALTEDFRQLKTRVPAASMWDSVYNEAQFTLEPYQAYQKTARPAEVRAAAELLKALKALSVVAKEPAATP